MTKKNWILVIAGVFITYLSFFLISFITTNYDGLYAFFSISLTVIGIILVFIGLSVDYENHSEAQ